MSQATPRRPPLPRRPLQEPLPAATGSEGRRVRTPKPLKRTRIGERDLRILFFLYQSRIARVGMVATAAGMGRTWCSSRLTDLKREGVVGLNQTLRNAPVWYTTRKGLAMIDETVDRNELPPLGTWTHELGIAGIAAQYVGLGHRVVTARQVLASLAFYDYSPSVLTHETDPAAAPEILAVPTRLARTRSNTHTPDLCIETAEGWVAVEVELSRKRNTDLQTVLMGYADAIKNPNHPVTSVVYFCGRPGIASAVSAQMREVVRHRGSGYDLLADGALQVLPYDPEEWGSVRVGTQ